MTNPDDTTKKALDESLRKMSEKALDNIVGIGVELVRRTQQAVNDAVDAREVFRGGGSWDMVKCWPHADDIAASGDRLVSEVGSLGGTYAIWKAEIWPGKEGDGSEDRAENKNLQTREAVRQAMYQSRDWSGLDQLERRILLEADRLKCSPDELAKLIWFDSRLMSKEAEIELCDLRRRVSNYEFFGRMTGIIGGLGLIAWWLLSTIGRP